MSNSVDSEIKQLQQDMYKLLMSQLVHFPKIYRFTISVDLRNSFNLLRHHINSAHVCDKKQTALRNADIELKNFKDIISTASQFKCISLKQHGVWIEHTVRLGKMLGGWIKKSKS